MSDPVVIAASDWKNSDPRVELVDLKRASIVILRPGLNGWEAGIGHAEMKHGWHIRMSFPDRPMLGDEAWNDDWLWTLLPEGCRA